MPVDKAISAAEANRQFSKLLRGVREGKSYVVTSHGRPVAKIAPVKAGDHARQRARDTLFKRLSAQRGNIVGQWSRDELYTDDE